MTSPPVAGKRRSLINTPSSEDQQLNIIAQEVTSSLQIFLCFMLSCQLSVLSISQSSSVVKQQLLNKVLRVPQA